MATTSGALAQAAIDAMAVSGVQVAVLHGADRLDSGEVSGDVDLVVDQPGPQVVARCRVAWEAQGLYPVVLWEYEPRAWSVFLLTESAEDGVQLDVTADDGTGKYGIDAAAMLAHAEPGRWPTVSAADHAAYTAAKQAIKRGGQHPNRTPRRLVREARRRVDRLVRPIGWWVHLDRLGAEDAAHEVAGRFGRVLPHAAAVDVSAGVRRAHIEVAVRRPGFVLTYGTPALLPAELVIDVRDPDEMAALIVANRALRLRERLPLVAV